MLFGFSPQSNTQPFTTTGLNGTPTAEIAYGPPPGDAGMTPGVASSLPSRRIAAADPKIVRSPTGRFRLATHSSPAAPSAALLLRVPPPRRYGNPSGPSRPTIFSAAFSGSRSSAPDWNDPSDQ